MYPLNFGEYVINTYGWDKRDNWTLEVAYDEEGIALGIDLMYWNTEVLGEPPTIEEIEAWTPPTPNPVEATKALFKMRAEERANLIETLKATVSVNMVAAKMALGKTQEEAYAEAIEQGAEFFDGYYQLIWAYREGGGPAFKRAVAKDTTRTWLDEVIPNTNGKTIRSIFQEML